MRKNRIRLTESQLHQVIKESVKRVLRETVEYGVLDSEGEVVATFKDKNMAYQFLNDNSDWCDEVVNMGSNGYIKPYPEADDDEY